MNPPSTGTPATPGLRAPWPVDEQAQLLAFYGPLILGTNGRPTAAWESATLTRIELPYRMRLAWDHSQTIGRLTCHRRVADSLKRILAGVLQLYGSIGAIEDAQLDLFGGSYEFRRIPGTNRLSAHAFGAAVDIGPEFDAEGRVCDPATSGMPSRVVDLFRKEGWRWGGDMEQEHCAHFQATQ